MPEVIGGSRNHFGPRSSEFDLPATIASSLVKTLIVPLNSVASVASLIATQDSDDESNMTIPAKSLIVSCHVKVRTAFTATTAVSITAGITGDTDGFLEAAGVGAKANLTADKWDQADGTAIGASVGSSDVNVVAAWNAADSTSLGDAVLVIEYIENVDSYLD